MPLISPEEALSLVDTQGCTPLMLAARAGAFDTCQRIVEVLCGPDATSSATSSSVLTKVDTQGRSVLHHALAAPTEETALFFLQK